jgi:heme/copper-type cytochrome/quinol oxidase subunit 2
VASFGSGMSLISAFLFIIIILEMFYSKRVFGRSWSDAPLPYQLSFQDPATAGMEGIIDLHHEIMFYIILIVTLVFWLLIRVVMLYSATGGERPVSFVVHSGTLEWA